MYTRLKRKRYSPAVATVDETAIKLIAVKKGERVIFGSILPTINCDTAGTISIGDSSGNAALFAATSMAVGTSPAGTIVNMGALTTLGTKLYTADDTITATYAHSGTPTVSPAINVEVGVVRGEQF
jgi:hypothetical protein